MGGIYKALGLQHSIQTMYRNQMTTDTNVSPWLSLERFRLYFQIIRVLSCNFSGFFFSFDCGIFICSSFDIPRLFENKMCKSSVWSTDLRLLCGVIWSNGFHHLSGWGHGKQSGQPELFIFLSFC